MYVMVITGCIKPDDNVPFVSVKNPSERLAEYEESLRWAVQDTSISKIIFVDTSNYDFSQNNFFIDLQKNTDKKIELLSFKADPTNLSFRGKGYGEGEALQYVIKSSKIINFSQDILIKLTGRLKVENFESIIKNVKPDILNININFPAYDMFDTRFYVMPWSLYLFKFKDIYKNVNDKMWICLEHLFYNTVHIEKLKNTCTSEYPLFAGRSGSTGKDYSNNEYLSILNALCKMKLLNNSFVIRIVNRLMIPRNRNKKN